MPLAYEEAQRLQADLSADATPVDKAKILNLLARVEAYMALTAQAEKHARLAQKIAEKNTDTVGQVEALLILTLTSTNQAKIDMLADTAARTVALLDGIDHPDLLGEAMSRLAMTNLRTDALEESLTIAMQAMEIAKRNNAPAALAYAHWGLAAVRESGAPAEETRAHYVQMREQARAAHSRLTEAIAMQGIADADGRLGNSAEAERLLRESITVFREVGTPFGLNGSLHSLAYLFSNQGQHAKAIPLLDEVIANFGTYPNPIGLWHALISRSTSLQMTGHLSEARVDAAKAYALAKEIGWTPYLSESLRRMTAMALAAGETRRAYELFLEVDELDAKAVQQRNSARILALTQRYESDSAKRKLDELNHQHKGQWMILGGLCAVLAVTFFSLLYLLRARAEIKSLNANRVQREGLLQKSEAEFRSLAENAVDKIARFDRQCRVLYLNPVMEASLNLSTADMLGKGADFFENGRFDELEVAIKQVIESGKNTDYYFTSADTGAGERHYQVRIVPEWADGKVVGALAIGRDITELKMAEAALRANEERMRLFFEHQMLGMAITSPEKGWLQVNDKLCAMLGYTRDELRLLSWVELTHPDDLALDEAQFDRLLDGEIDSYMLEKRFVRKDGGIVHTNLGIDCVRRGDRSVDYVLAVLEDISERKRMEQELREQKDFQQILLNGLKEVGIQIMIVENGRIVYIMDHQTFLYYGHTQEEIDAGLTLRDIIHPDDLARVMDAYSRRLAGESVPSSYEISLISRSGERLEYDTSVTIVPGTNPVRIITVGKDITERKRAEQKLKEALEFSEGVISAIPDILFEVDKEGRYLNLWTHTPELLAAQKEVLLGNTFFDVLSPESASIAMGALREAEEAGVSFGKVIHIDLPQGARWFELSVSRKNAGSPTGTTFLALSRDITERKRMEAKLIEREREFRTLAENATDPIYRYDRDCRRIYVNPAVAKISGKPLESFIGSTPDDGALLVSGQSSRLIEAIRNVFASGETRTLMVDFVDQDGEHRDYHMLLIPEYDANGQVITVLSMARDVTEIRRLQQRQAQFFAIAPGFFATVEHRGDGSYAMPFASDGVRDLYGLEPEAVMRDIGALVEQTHPDDIAMTFRKTEESERGLIPFHVEYRIIHPTKGVRWLECNSVPQRLPDGGTRWNGFYYDITERREAQMQLESQNLELQIYRGKLEQRVAERTVELDSSNRQLRIEIGERKKTEDELRESREQLRGLMVRHEDVREEERKHIARELHDELGQIMTALKMNVQMLAGNVGENLPSLRKQAQQAEAAVVEAMGVVRSLSSSLRPVELDMGIISALEWAVKRFATFTHIECCLHVERGEINPDEPRAIALFRIVQESLTNVAKHAQASRVDISLARDADDYVLKVRDNGKGFDTSAKKAGSFGLVGIRERVLMLGGTVAIDSRSKMGTEIVVRLPSGENT